jgi:hypothetical protein
MAVIDAQLGVRFALADRAQPILRGQHEVVVGLGEAVDLPEPSFGVGHRLFLRQRRAEQELLLGLLALTRKPACHPSLLAILRILGITQPHGREHLLAELVILGVALAVVRERPLPVFRILGIALSPQVFPLCHLPSPSICAHRSPRPCRQPASRPPAESRSRAQTPDCLLVRPVRGQDESRQRAGTINTQLSMIPLIHDSRAKVK